MCDMADPHRAVW